jgi:hypothetical protein
MFSVVGGSSYDSETLIVIAERKRDSGFNQMVFLNLLCFCQQNIAVGYIHMEYTGENKLYGAAFGADNQIKTFQIAFEALFQLFADMNDCHNDRNTKREYKYIEDIADSIMAEAGITQFQYIHDASFTLSQTA